MNEMLKNSGIVAPVTNEIGGSEEPEEPDVPPTPEEPPKVEEIKGGEAFDERTTIEDAEGNKIVVPAGFKIASDSGNTVQQGIVIEDVSASTDSVVQGSQFVWIPIGVFIKDGGTPSNEIILGRYTFANDSVGTPTLQQAAYTDENPENYKNSVKLIGDDNTRYFEYYGEYREGVEERVGEGASAYDLKAWIDSAKTNGGYYIGRYEASFASGTSVENYKAATKISTRNSATSMSYAKGTLWNKVTQIKSSKISINTYFDSKFVKSDLMNSYAWDTAIVFIEEAGNINFANQKIDTEFDVTNTGSGNDEICNINDITSNLVEWTTETADSEIVWDDLNLPCTLRGGMDIMYERVTYRYSIEAIYNSSYHGFRLTLYMEPETE